MGQGRVAHEAAGSWAIGNRMGPAGSARRTLICSERLFRSIFASADASDTVSTSSHSNDGDGKSRGGKRN